MNTSVSTARMVIKAKITRMVTTITIAMTVIENDIYYKHHNCKTNTRVTIKTVYMSAPRSKSSSDSYMSYDKCWVKNVSCECNKY